MPIRLERLSSALAITDEQSRPTPAFQRWWQKTVETIEYIINDVIVAALVRLGAVEIQADGTAVLAESAINPGGTIKDDKVLTDSMVDNAATVISSLFYNHSGGSIGSSGSFVDMPGGPAVVSVATGTKATQQCFVKALVGVKRGGGSNDIVIFRCVRNDATILAQTYTQEATNDQAIMPLAFIDPAPTASVTHTYTLEIKSGDSATQVREVFIEGFLGKTG